MYKTYGIQMYYTLITTARDGIDAHFAGDKEARNIAARQLAGVVGSTFMLAGVVGLPFAREIMQLLDLFSSTTKRTTSKLSYAKQSAKRLTKARSPHC
jgi:hypothetical protein